MKRPFKYPDTYWILIGSILIGHFIVTLDRDESLVETFQLWHYYLDMPFASGITALVWLSVRFITTRLDKIWDWQNQTWLRVGAQLILGVGLPSVLSFGLAFLFFKIIYQVNLSQTSFPVNEFPVSVLFILMFNLFYVVLYFYQLNIFQQQQLIELQKNQQNEYKPLIINTLTGNKRNKFIVNIGAKNIPVLVEDIACFYREEDYVYMRTLAGEQYLMNESLDDLMTQLPENQFFRANRQVIVQQKACKFYTQEDYGKLKLSLEPVWDKEIIISQKKAQEFKNWLNS
jgi:hypothetical protein